MSRGDFIALIVPTTSFPCIMIQSLPAHFMKILVAPAHYLFSDKYGSEPLWAVELVEAIANQVEHVDVIVGVNDVARKLPENIRVLPLFPKRSSSPFIELVRRILFYFLVWRKALTLEPLTSYQAIHHILPFSYATFNPLLVWTKWRYPQIVTVIGPAQMPYQTSDVRDADLVLVGKKIDPLSQYIIGFVVLVGSRLITYLSKRMTAYVDVLVCTSQKAKAFYRIVRSGKIEVIPPGIFQPSVKTKKLSQNVKILGIGGLVKRKGFENLIKALSQLPPHYCVVMVGDGPEKESLQDLARDLKCADRIEWVGQVGHSEIGKYYLNAHVFCLPSYNDSYPTVLMEALSYGLPLIATDVGSCKEIVGDCGIVISSGNVEAIVDAVKKLTHSSTSYHTLSQRCLERAKSMFSYGEIARQYANLYHLKK